MGIYLIRHGETPSNAARIIQTAETPLSERGLEQAGRLAQRLAEADVRHILSSDLRRAVMTSEALRERTGVEIELEPLLQERNFGALRGTPYAELQTDPFAPDGDPPEGETWSVFHDRVAHAWERVETLAEELGCAAGSGGHLAVVTHGLVCRAIVMRHLREPAAGASADEVGAWDTALRFPNTALTVIEAGPPWRVSRLSCIDHLAEDGESGPDRAPA